MADKTGYIGRNPNDSAVTVARQFFTASGVTTTFTFASGYLTGYLDVYVDGVKRRVADEFTATDGSTFDVLQGGVSAGSTVEAVAYKAFNAAAISGDITGNFDVSGNTTLGGSLSVTGGTTLSNINVTGIATLGAGTTVAFANTAFNLSGTPDISVDLLSAVDINVSGAATIGGVLTYEDVTNIDSVGIVTARTGVEVTANGLVVNAGVSTFAADVSIADKIVHTGDTNTAIRFPSADTITAETAGVERFRIDSNGDVGLVGIATATGLVVVAGSGVYAGHTGVVTAVTFDGNVTGNVTGNISGGTVAGSTGTFTGDVDIADKIVHTGDTNTAIRFPAADTFTVETAGSERIRIRSNGVIIKGNSGTQETVGNGANTQLIGSGSADASLALIRQASGGGEFYFAAGTSGTNIADDNGLGFIKFMGYHTNGYDEYARIEALVDGTNGDGDAPGRLIFRTSADGSASPTERLRIDSSGTASFAGDVSIVDKIIHTGDTNTAIRFPGNDTFTVETVGSEALRVDGGQRLLMGATSSRGIGHATAAAFEIEGTSATVFASVVKNSNDQYGSSIALGKTRGTSVGDNTSVNSGDEIGSIRFAAADGTDVQTRAAQITAIVDGTPGSNDMPGRLVFSTTADGASSPTERARIDSSGRLLIGGSSSQNQYGSQSNLQVVGTGFDSSTIALRRDQNNANPPGVIFAKSRSGSIGGSTIVQNGDQIGTMIFAAADGSDLTSLAAEIRVKIDGAPGSNDTPGRIEFHTTADGAAAPTERLRITSAGHVSIVGDDQKLIIGAGDDLQIYHDGSESYIADEGTGGITISSGLLSFKNQARNETHATMSVNGSVDLYYDNSKKFETTSSGVTVTGAVQDSIGDLRSIPLKTESSSASYTLIASDAGKTIHVHTTTTTVVVPNSVFSAGDAVSIVNGDGSNTPTISQGTGFSLRNTGDGTSGNRTLGVYGMATIYFTGAGVGYISGSGMT